MGIGCRLPVHDTRPLKKHLPGPPTRSSDVGHGGPAVHKHFAAVAMQLLAFAATAALPGTDRICMAVPDGGREMASSCAGPGCAADAARMTCRPSATHMAFVALPWRTVSRMVCSFLHAETTTGRNATVARRTRRSKRMWTSPAKRCDVMMTCVSIISMAFPAKTIHYFNTKSNSNTKK